MRFRVLILLPLLAAAASCGWIRNDPKTQKGFQNEKLDLSCLQKIPENLNALFTGTLEDSAGDGARLQQIFPCVNHALGVFGTMTRGSTPDAYSSSDLQSFANRNLPPENPISDSFIRSIFVLKQSILGGTERTITKDELKSLQSRVLRFGDLIAPLAPHLRILMKPADASLEMRTAAGTALGVFVRGLPEVLADSRNPLEWKELGTFLEELEKFISRRNGKTPETVLALVREQLPVLQYSKLLLVGGSESAIEAAKWKPIFNSIANLYGAFLITQKPSEILDQTWIEVESTEPEQARAVQKLIETLQSLSANEQLTTRPIVLQFSDGFAKALFVNSLLFPRTRGSLALRQFFGNAELRKTAGRLAEQALKLDPNHLTPKVLAPLVRDLIEVIRLAAVSDSGWDQRVSTLSLTRTSQYLDELDPMLQDKTLKVQFQKYLPLIKEVLPFLVGNDGETLRPRQVAGIIGKGFDFYATWDPQSTDPMNQKLGDTLEILVRAPSFEEVSVTQIKGLLARLEETLREMSPATVMDWNLIRSYLDRGMKLKATFFRTPETKISIREVRDAAMLFEPLRWGKSMTDSMFMVSDLLLNTSIPNAPIAEVISAVNSFLPKEYQTETLGLTLDLIRLVKPVAVGGNRDSFSRQDYSVIARLGGNILRDVYPRYQELGSGFKPGVDSKTFDLVHLGLRAFADSRAGEIRLTDLKALIREGLRRVKLFPQEPTIDKFLSGFHTRVLKRMKSPKPKSLEGLGFGGRDLGPFIALTARIRDELAPLEASFPSPETEVHRDELIGRLRSPSAQKILRNIQPVLFGKEHRLRYPRAGEVLNQFNLYDVSFKFMVFQVVEMLFPLYKVSKDPQGPNTARLNVTDLTDLLTDLNDLITELKLVYGYAPASKSALARLRSINLFTRNGNGDQYIDTTETTEFLTITQGGKKALLEIEAVLYPACFPEVQDFDRISEIPVSCLKRVYFQKAFFARIYGEIAPELIRQMVTWDDAGMDSFRKSMLTAIYPAWKEDGAFPRVELESLVSVPHFTENLFQRFNVNRDDYLQFSEIMKSFSIFCMEIKNAGGPLIAGSCEPGKKPKQVEAIFGYLIFKGEPPRGIKPGDNFRQRVAAIKEIFCWFKDWRKLDKRPSVRDKEPPMLDRKDILKIMSNLSTAL